MQTLKEEIKNKIIEAALQEFTESGFEKASMRNIAKAAGITVSNIYNYYTDKEQLFGSIVEPVFHQVKEIFNASVNESAKPGFAMDNYQSYIDRLVDVLIQLDERQRQLLILLIEKSDRTRYGKARKEIIEILKSRMVEAVRKIDGIARVSISQSYILDIMAGNYIDGLLQILRVYRSQSWAEENLRLLLTCHLNGLKALL